MKEIIFGILMAIVILGVTVIAIAVKISNYNECRTQFSTLYCITRK